MKFKVYTWHFDGEIEDFFHKLRSITVEYKLRKGFLHSDPDCFVLRERANGRFELWYQKQHVYNGFTMFLFGRVIETQSGVTIKGEVRMTEIGHVFMLFWFGFVFVALIICALILSPGIIVPIIMIVLGAILYKFAQAQSNPKGIIELMDNLCSPESGPAE